VAIRKLGGELVGVSKDTPAVADEFCRSLDLPYTLVGDETGAVIKAYGAAWPLLGLAKRVTYVVGRDKKIKITFRSERDVAAHVAKAKEALAALSGT
jgi:thioredoxin-dependent peroxiredoxin